MGFDLGACFAYLGVNKVELMCFARHHISSVPSSPKGCLERTRPHPGRCIQWKCLLQRFILDSSKNEWLIHLGMSDRIFTVNAIACVR